MPLARGVQPMGWRLGQPVGPLSPGSPAPRAASSIYSRAPCAQSVFPCWGGKDWAARLLDAGSVLLRCEAADSLRSVLLLSCPSPQSQCVALSSGHCGPSRRRGPTTDISSLRPWRLGSEAGRQQGWVLREGPSWLCPGCGLS